MTQPYAIGLDIGTGSAKAIAINISGKIIAASQFFYPALSPQPGFSEQDPEQIWTTFVQCIQTIILQLKEAPAIISLSSCMHSLVAINSEGKPLTNLITWADTRSEAIAEQLRQSTEGKSMYHNSGTPIHSMSPLCKIIWLRENEPDVFNQAALFISIKEYIWHRLFTVYEVDYSIASATGLFHIEKLAWNRAALTLAGIAVNQLSTTVPTHFLRSTLHTSIASQLTVPPNVPFCIGASDGCLANVGSYALRPGIAAITIGTSGAVRLANPAPIQNYEAMLFNYILDEHLFICGGPVNNGGNIIQWTLQYFSDIPSPGKEEYTLLFDTIEKLPAGAQGLLFLPYLYGERAPVWDEKGCGVFFGIKAHHTKAHFLRAAVEGVCYSLLHVLEIVEAATPVIQINVSGGFIHSDTWMHLLADVTGKKLALVQTEDASAVGAALFGMKHTTMIEDYFSLQPGTEIFIEPDWDNHHIHKKNYSIFKTLYGTLKETMHRLHHLNH